MKKYLWHLLVLCFLFIYGSASAQTDSAYLDLGRIKIRKDLTQHVTIKGSDLEHMPFARITDALAPWLLGTLTTRTNLVFVVDGNVISDVDAWSIYDIEEITLVQNALTQHSGPINNQQLVVVTTKRKHAAQKGITVSGSSYLANVDYPDASDPLKSDNNFYHQYHVGAWQNSGKISYGASASWLRDVMPMEKNIFDVNKPRQLNRFRFNGWADATLAEGHTLTLRMNVVPQTISIDVTSVSPGYSTTTTDLTSKNNIINPSLHLSNRIAKEWLHELDFSYLTSRSPQDSHISNQLLPPASGNFESTSRSVFKYHNALLRDRISYTHTMGGWEFQPSLSFSYRSMKQSNDYRQTSYSNGVLNGFATFTSSFKAESYVLAPALSLSYRNVFSIAGGMSAKLKKDNTIFKETVYPFFTTMVDVLRVGQTDNPYSLKIFGSFANPADFIDARYQLPDLTVDDDPIYGNLQGPIFGGNIMFMPYPDDVTTRSYQAGASFLLPGNKLQVSYNYDTRRYPGNFLVPIYGGGYAVYHPDYLYSAHRLGVITRLIDKGEVLWLSGINATGFKYQIKDEDAYPSWADTRDANNDKMRWTGGFINRFQCKSFSFGLDILYLLNEYRFTGPAADDSKTNSFRLNNIYAGYSIKIANNKPLELYLSARNLMQSDKSEFPDNRRYYGAGFRLVL